MASNNLARSNKLLDLSQRFLQSKHVSTFSNAESNQSQRPNRAAVLICLFEEGDDIYVILTKRSSKLSSYSGNVSLLGGRTHDGNTDDVQIALREAEEEIGLNPGLVDVITVLQPFKSKANVTIVPVMGILWDKQAFNPVLNAEDVETVFYAPIEMFLKDENGGQEEIELRGEKDIANYFDHKNNRKVHVNVISPVTADILITTASMVYQHHQSSDCQPKVCNSRL